MIIKTTDWRKTMAYKITKHRRGTTLEWAQIDSLIEQLTPEEIKEKHLIPGDGELVIEECEQTGEDGTSKCIRKCKIGDGIKPFSKLPYITDQVAEELALELNDLKTHINDEIDVKLDNLDLSIDSLDQRITASNETLTSKITANEKDIKIVSEDIGEIGKSLGQANTEISQLKTILGLEEENNSPDSLPETMSGGILNVFAQGIEDLQGKVQKLEDADSVTEEVLKAVNSSLADLTTKKVSTEAFNILSKSVETNTANITTNTEKIVDNTENIKVNTVNINANAESINSNTENIAVNTENIVINAENITANAENINTNTENIEILDARLSANETTVEKLNTSVINLEEGLLTVGNNITTVQEAVANNATAISTTSIALENLVNEDLVELSDYLDKAHARITNLVTPEDCPVDDELLDVRTGYNNIIHACAGDAVRAVGNDLRKLKNELTKYSVNGLRYEDNELTLMLDGTPVGNPVTITGGTGTGGGSSTVKLKSNISTVFTAAKGTKIYLNFSYSSIEDDEPTGNGTYIISRDKNRTKILESGSIENNKDKQNPIEVTKYLQDLEVGTYELWVTCVDPTNGESKSLCYTITLDELRIEPDASFEEAIKTVFTDKITFRYKVYGQVDKTVYVILDNTQISKIDFDADTTEAETTLIIPKQSHGCHKLKAYVTSEVLKESNVLEYELACVDESSFDDTAMLISNNFNTTEITQGELISIPYLVYDPGEKGKYTVARNIYKKNQSSGQYELHSSKEVDADNSLQHWSTKDYPTGLVMFEVKYTYSNSGAEETLIKQYEINIKPLDVKVTAEKDALQLYLSAVGRDNQEKDNADTGKFDESGNLLEYFDTGRNSWTFISESYGKVQTKFENFNWESNGWLPDDDINGDTCLRLNGDARAVIDFEPFSEDFKQYGKTLEFEFAVHDVNDRRAVVIDCLDVIVDESGNEIEYLKGFRATPDTAFLKSAGTLVSCRYKDEERVRVTVSIEPFKTTNSHFVSIYLDGILSGVQRYPDSDDFEQKTKTKITLGSSLCGLDLYSIRIYDKALTTKQVLNNYIADKADPVEKQQLVTDNDLLKTVTSSDGSKRTIVSYDAVRALGQLPIITFTGEMPKFKGDKRKNVRMKFEDPLHPELNFDVLLKEIDVQGTSSQYYVRKNWKVKLFDEQRHMPGAIPAKVFCIKVDYAEATGTHNTGTANYVETLYDRAFEKNESGEIVERTGTWIPPQYDDERARTTIQGRPCVIFEKANKDATPIFSSKANFNYDKGSENVFGFTEKYDKYGVECWEVCNNTSPACNFTGEIPTDWSSDFEPRYVPDSYNFGEIEDLLELREDAANGEATFTDEDAARLAELQDGCIPVFKQLHDWVLSTATQELIIETDENGNDKIVGTRPITPADGTTITIKGEEYPDSIENRLKKFKDEFKDYFNLHYCCVYYVYTFFALMTDQRAKNMFLTRWKDGKNEQGEDVYHWYPYFYDNDTIFGINNEGALVFDYYHEDFGEAGRLGSSNVYNGQNSTLWSNFRSEFAKDIADTYKELRQEKLTYANLIDRYVTNHSDLWSAAIYNEDAEYKYVSMAREIQTSGEYKGSVDDSNLYQVRGPGEHHLRYFLANRLNYCDSKWYAGDYPDDYIFLRIYTPTTTIPRDTTLSEAELISQYGEEQVKIYKSLKAVPANPGITLTPFSTMYAGVKYKANGVMQQTRLTANEQYTFTPPTAETFNDTETGIYGASEISSLDDLSGLYCGVISLGKASKLKSITLGSAKPDYHNDNFREIRVGANRLLEYLDLRNCSGLGVASGASIDSGMVEASQAVQGIAQTTLDLSKCPNIKTVYTEGTKLKIVSLPESGYLGILHLPKSATTIKIKNQTNLTFKTEALDGFWVEDDDYSNIETLYIDNCPGLDCKTLLDKCINAQNTKLNSVHLAGGITETTWRFENANYLKYLLAQNIKGVDSNDENISYPYIEGTCFIQDISGEDYADLSRCYSKLTIKFGSMTSEVTFKYVDTEGNYHQESKRIAGENSQLGDLTGFIPEATPGIDKSNLKTEGAFNYTFVGWSRMQQICDGINDDKANDEHFWEKWYQLNALTEIAGNRILYPVFRAERIKYPVRFMNGSKEELVLEIAYGDKAEYPSDLPEPIKTNTAVPENYEFTTWRPDPSTVPIEGPTEFYAQFSLLSDKWHEPELEEFMKPNSDKVGYSISGNNLIINNYDNFAAVNNAVRIPQTYSISTDTYFVTELASQSFFNHTEIELLSLPESLTTIGYAAFYRCLKLAEVDLPTSLITIGKYAFQETALDSITIPQNVSTIGEAAFAKCSNLSHFQVNESNPYYQTGQDGQVLFSKAGTLLHGLSKADFTKPEDYTFGTVTINALGAYCFAGTKLSSIFIPANFTTLPSNAFSGCNLLQTVVFSSDSTLTTIRDNCFAGCTVLTAIDLPNTVTQIESTAFDNCPIEDVYIPSSVNVIRAQAFARNSALRTITFAPKTDDDGNIVIPSTIATDAFLNSGYNESLIIKLPWSREQHIAKFGTDTFVWGAKNITEINFNFMEETA